MKTVLNTEDFFPLLFQDAVNCHVEEACCEKKRSDLDNFLLLWVEPFLPISWYKLAESTARLLNGNRFCESVLSFGSSAWLYSLMGWLILVTWKETTMHSYFPLRHVALPPGAGWPNVDQFEVVLVLIMKTIKGQCTWCYVYITAHKCKYLGLHCLSQNQWQPQFTVLHCTFLMALWHALVCQKGVGDQLRLACKKLHSRQRSRRRGRVRVMAGEMAYFSIQRED